LKATIPLPLTHWLPTITWLATQSCANVAYCVPPAGEATTAVPFTVPLSVEKIVKSNLDADAFVAGGMVTDMINRNYEKEEQLYAVCRDVLADYKKKATLSHGSASRLTLGKLTVADQDTLERKFDEGIIGIYGKEQAAKVKFCFVNMMHVHCGAFGKYELNIEREENQIFITSGPIKKFNMHNTHLMKSAGLIPTQFLPPSEDEN
jgi:hypothetical protein